MLVADSVLFTVSWLTIGDSDSVPCKDIAGLGC